MFLGMYVFIFIVIYLFGVFRFLGLKYDIPVNYIQRDELTVDIKEDMLEVCPRKTIAELLTSHKVSINFKFDLKSF